LWTEDKTLADL